MQKQYLITNLILISILSIFITGCGKRHDDISSISQHLLNPVGNKAVKAGMQEVFMQPNAPSLKSWNNFWFESISKQDYIWVRDMVWGGWDVNIQKNPDSNVDLSIRRETGLIFAIKNHKNTMVELLLILQADVFLEDCCNFNALQLAVYYNNIQAINIIIGHPEINIDQPNSFGMTALTLAYILKNEEIIVYLENIGATSRCDDKIIKELQFFISDGFYRNTGENDLAILKRIY